MADVGATAEPALPSVTRASSAITRGDEGEAADEDLGLSCGGMRGPKKVTPCSSHFIPSLHLTQWLAVDGSIWSLQKKPGMHW